MRISDWSSDVCASDLQVFMREPSVRASRLAIAGGAAATIVIGAVGFFLGRATYPTPEPITPVVIEAPAPRPSPTPVRSEEHTSELQSLMRISYAVFCLKKNKITTITTRIQTQATN